MTHRAFYACAAVCVLSAILQQHCCAQSVGGSTVSRQRWQCEYSFTPMRVFIRFRSTQVRHTAQLISCACAIESLERQPDLQAPPYV